MKFLTLAGESMHTWYDYEFSLKNAAFQKLENDHRGTWGTVVQVCG